MRARDFLLAVTVMTAGSGLAPAPSQAFDEMEQQRCVWRCLADSQGASDPAYNACVERYCTEEALSAPAMSEPAQPVPPAATASPGMSTVAPTAPVGAHDRMTVTVVQRALLDLGLYPGPIDGIYGGRTAVAVERFRQSRGMPAGAIDGELVYRLRQESARQ